MARRSSIAATPTRYSTPRIANQWALKVAHGLARSESAWTRVDVDPTWTTAIVSAPSSPKRGLAELLLDTATTAGRSLWATVCREDKPSHRIDQAGQGASAVAVRPTTASNAVAAIKAPADGRRRPAIVPITRPARAST